MKNSPLLLLFLVSYAQVTLGQLEFTKKSNLLFVGADSIEGKAIVAGTFITPLDSATLQVRIDILENWVQKDTLKSIVILDTSSMRNDLYFITRNGERVASYRFFNKEGLEVLIGKERWHDGIYSDKGEKMYSMSLAKVYLPKHLKCYIRTLPLMFEK